VFLSMCLDQASRPDHIDGWIVWFADMRNTVARHDYGMRISSQTLRLASAGFSPGFVFSVSSINCLQDVLSRRLIELRDRAVRLLACSRTSGARLTAEYAKHPLKFHFLCAALRVLNLFHQGKRRSLWSMGRARPEMSQLLRTGALN